MDRFLARRKFFMVFDAGQPVHGRWCFPSLPHFSFIALTSDRAGEHLDLGETLLSASTAPADNANLGKFMTAALGTCTPAATRQDIVCPMGAWYWSIIGGCAKNYGELRVGTVKWGVRQGRKTRSSLYLPHKKITVIVHVYILRLLLHFPGSTVSYTGIAIWGKVLDTSTLGDLNPKIGKITFAVSFLPNRRLLGLVAPPTASAWTNVAQVAFDLHDVLHEGIPSQGKCRVFPYGLPNASI
jgi:hypothetical protein